MLNASQVTTAIGSPTRMPRITSEKSRCRSLLPSVAMATNMPMTMRAGTAAIPPIAIARRPDMPLPMSASVTRQPQGSIGLCRFAEQIVDRTARSHVVGQHHQRRVDDPDDGPVGRHRSAAANAQLPSASPSSSAPAPGVPDAADREVVHARAGEAVADRQQEVGGKSIDPNALDVDDLGRHPGAGAPGRARSPPTRPTLPRRTPMRCSRAQHVVATDRPSHEGIAGVHADGSCPCPCDFGHGVSERLGWDGL